MSIAKIEQLVKQLDITWFKSKKEWFEKETFYSSKLGKIYDELQEDYDHDGNPEPPTIIDISFKKYCWNCYYPNGFSAYEYYDDLLPIDANDVSASILSEIDKVIQEVKTDESKNNIIIASRDTIIETIEDLQKGNEDNDLYVEVLNEFLMKARKSISDKHGAFKRAYDIATTHQDKLRFNLKLDELALLLQILFNGDFIHRTTPDDSTYTTFYKKYFYFRNQRKGNKFTRADDITKRLSDVRNNEITQRCKDEFKKKLIAAIKTVK